jgi:hypothetical protein
LLVEPRPSGEKIESAQTLTELTATGNLATMYPFCSLKKVALPGQGTKGDIDTILFGDFARLGKGIHPGLQVEVALKRVGVRAKTFPPNPVDGLALRHVFWVVSVPVWQSKVTPDPE